MVWLPALTAPLCLLLSPSVWILFKTESGFCLCLHWFITLLCLGCTVITLFCISSWSICLFMSLGVLVSGILGLIINFVQELWAIISLFVPCPWIHSYFLFLTRFCVFVYVLLMEPYIHGACPCIDLCFDLWWQLFCPQ